MDPIAERNREQVRHEWINEWAEQERSRGQQFPHHLYEFMHGLQEIPRLALWIGMLRTDALPRVHQQCSRSEPERIEVNRLICALAQDVATCPILASVRSRFEAKCGQSYYTALTDEHIDRTQAEVCVWHIFTSTMQAAADGGFLDTSEGYVQDESDRRFWRTTYEHMRGEDLDWDNEGGMPE